MGNTTCNICLKEFEDVYELIKHEDEDGCEQEVVQQLRADLRDAVGLLNRAITVALWAEDGGHITPGFRLGTEKWLARPSVKAALSNEKEEPKCCGRDCYLKRHSK